MYFFSNILNLKVPDRKITFENFFSQKHLSWSLTVGAWGK